MIKLAINGYGRIGKSILKALYEYNRNKEFKIVAINDLSKPEVNAHLTKYDTVHGRFNASVEVDSNNLYINSDPIKLFAERDPSNLPWGDLDIDVVLECTGSFVNKTSCEKHLIAGAKKVIISAPAKDPDATIVYGVNHHIIDDSMTIISNASCTTNCLAPMAKVLNDTVGIESCIMTTIHSYTNDQRLTDISHADPYRARAAALNMIPTATGAANAVGIVIPELKGKFDGMAVRIPTANVSLVDMIFIAKKETSVEEINQIVAKASSSPDLVNVLSINHQPLVSTDFNHNSFSSNFDATQTKVQGMLVKVMSWYDNEWGFANRMLDTAKVFAGK